VSPRLLGKIYVILKISTILRLPHDRQTAREKVTPRQHDTFISTLLGRLCRPRDKCQLLQSRSKCL
jgi:hypothetical protein